MRRPLLALAFALAAGPLHAADLLPYKSDSATFRARFPAPPETDTKELAVGGARTVPIVTHQAADPKSKAVFSVTVAEYPPLFAEVPADTLLDGVQDGLKGKDGRVKPEKPVGAVPPGVFGRAVRIEAGRNVVRARLYLVGTRLIQVTVAGTSKNYPEKAADEFFAGFEPVR